MSPPDISQSADVASKIAIWKAKQEAGTMTAQDWREAMADLRQARATAAAGAAAAKARKAPVDVEALKNSLKALKKAE
jgi:hypothetical protein